MNKRITAVYEVEDGYVGKSAPHEFDIDIDNTIWGVSNVKEAMENVYEQLQEEFQKSVHPYLTNEEEIKTALEQALTAREIEEAEEEE